MGPISQPFTVHTTLWDVKKTHTLVAKSRAYSSRCCGQASGLISFINVLGEIAYGLTAAANGACIC